MTTKIEYDAQTDRVQIRDGDGVVKYDAPISDTHIVSSEGVWDGTNRKALIAHVISVGGAEFSVGEDFKSGTVSMVATHTDPFGVVARDTLRIRVECLSASDALVAKLRAEIVVLGARLDTAQTQLQEMHIFGIMQTIEDKFGKESMVGRRRFSRMLIVEELAGHPITFAEQSPEIGLDDDYLISIPIFANFVIADDCKYRAMRIVEEIDGITKYEQKPRFRCTEDVIVIPKKLHEKAAIAKPKNGMWKRYVSKSIVMSRPVTDDEDPKFSRFDSADTRDFRAMYDAAIAATRQFIGADGCIRDEWLDEFKIE